MTASSRTPGWSAFRPSAAGGWSKAETARRMLVTPLTVDSWNKRLDDEGPDALVQMRDPVNRFPELVG